MSKHSFPNQEDCWETPCTRDCTDPQVCRLWESLSLMSRNRPAMEEGSKLSQLGTSEHDRSIRE